MEDPLVKIENLKTYFFTPSGLARAVDGIDMEIDTGEGELTSIYGIGSISYWSSQDLDQPTIGENVEVEYTTITFSDDSTKEVAVTITFLDSGEDILLRDLDTCAPLWRGNQK